MKFPRLLPLLFIFLATGFPAATGSTRALLPVEARKAVFMSGGRKIQVEIFAPNTTGRFPAVLVLHSSAGTLIGQRELQGLGRSLAAQGMIAFLVRYFDRTGTIVAGDKAINKLSPLWVATAQDGVDFVSAHPSVQPRAIGIFGYSLGAFVAVAESSRDDRIRAVAAVAGGIFEGFEGRMQRLPSLLILHGRADQRVPVLRAFELQRAARRLGARTEMKLYDGEGHRLSRAASADAAQRVITFLERQLQNQRQQRPTR